IAAHRKWKITLRKAITEKQTLDAEVICRDDRCALGLWIHGAGGRQWRNKPGFSELVSKHAQFHQSAGTVAKTINAGDYQRALGMIDVDSQFSAISGEVVNVILHVKSATANALN
ncbi:MAG: CZB domain-containing protein, partial [Sphingomonadaceae bacterium]